MIVTDDFDGVDAQGNPVKQYTTWSFTTAEQAEKHADLYAGAKKADKDKLNAHFAAEKAKRGGN